MGGEAVGLATATTTVAGLAHADEAADLETAGTSSAVRTALASAALARVLLARLGLGAAGRAGCLRWSRGPVAAWLTVAAPTVAAATLTIGALALCIRAL
jgi:hypothetical protein